MLSYNQLISAVIWSGPNSIAGLISLVDIQTHNLLISKTLVCRTWDYCNIFISLKQDRSV